MVFSGNGLNVPIQANSDGSSVCPNHDGCHFSKIYVEDKSAVSVARRIAIRGLLQTRCTCSNHLNDQECSNEKKDFVHQPLHS